MTDFPAATPQQLGAILRGYRREKGLSQQRVGSAAGLPQGAISLIESDPGPASLVRIYRVLSALNLELVVRPRQAGARPTEW
ncbi:MAG: helix-turn-helix domain-containing protein [Verrucomicrobiae bacterium]|nr:helix-turn-helix domain-containing protein [Verrucomicrobiae bacterium]